MARKKVKLAYITNDTARRATFKKRRKGLMKKVSELSTLCGVSACAIVNGPYDRQPEIWPEQSEAHRVLMRFKSLPEMDQNKKQLNQETFTYNRIGKISEQFKKQQRENRYMEITGLYNLAIAGKCSISDVLPTDLGDLAYVLEEKKKEVQRRLSALKKASTPVEQTSPANASSAISNAPNASDASTTAIPNAGTNIINTDVSVSGAYVSGINGGTVTGGGLYGGVVNHHNQGGGDKINGTGGQEFMTLDQMRASMEALQSQPWYMDVMKPPSIPQPDDQMANYLNLVGGDHYNKDDNQMMGGGGVPPPMPAATYYNGGSLGDVVNNSNAWMMPPNNSYVPMNHIDASRNSI